MEANLGLFGYLAVLLSVLLFAAAKGGGPERWGAITFSLMIALQFLLALVIPRTFQTVDPASLAVDLVGLAGFLAIALNARRLWPIWAASIQMLSCIAHFARGAQTEVETVVYFIMKTMPTTFVIIVLFLGTLYHLRRMRIRGEDPSWMGWKV